MNTIPTPSSILQTAFGFWGSKVLLTAVEVGLFTKLADHRLTGAQLGKELQFHPCANPNFFDAFVAMKFLDRQGDGPHAKYFNTPEGAMFLDGASPRCIRGTLVMLSARLFKLRTASRKMYSYAQGTPSSGCDHSVRSRSYATRSRLGW